MENKQSFPTLPLLAWLTTLIGMVLLPNTIGAGGGGPGFIGTALLMLFLTPLAWLPLSWVQAKWLKSFHILDFSPIRLSLSQILCMIPVTLLFVTYPSEPWKNPAAAVVGILQIVPLQLLLLLLLKGFLLSLKNVTSPFVYIKVLSVDLLGFCLLWVGLVLPTNLAETHFSHDWAVKRQMIELQTLLETYAVDAGGLYPQNREQLKQQALSGQYWKELDLPSCQDYFLWQGIENQLKGKVPAKRKTFLEVSDPIQACAIRYLPADNFSGYFIYGYGPEQTRIKDKGQDFFLSNG